MAAILLDSVSLNFIKKHSVVKKFKKVEIDSTDFVMLDFEIEFKHHLVVLCFAVELDCSKVVLKYFAN